MHLELLDDFKPILSKRISKQLREYSSIYKELNILVYGIQKLQTLHFMLT